MTISNKHSALQLFLLVLTLLCVSGCTHKKDGVDLASPIDESRDPERWPVIHSKVKKSPEMEAKIARLVSSMTLEQKVAQIIQPEIRDVTIEDMRRYGFGSYLNGGGAYPGNNKHATTQDWLDLAEAMYQASMDDSLDGIAIPTMWGTDAVHGHNNVIGATIFPHNIGLGAAHNPELIRRIAKATANEVMATGIDWVFAPTVAVVRDDRWGRTYEGYSEDPKLVRDYSAQIVTGLQGEVGPGFLGEDRVISTIKHFVGDGGTNNGDDQGNNLGSEEDLINLHAQGYFSGLEAGAQVVMASFNSWQGEKMHGHHYLLTTVLKERMGFDGVVVGDWNGHGQVPGCDNSSCPQAVNAGIDILMAPTSTWKPLFDNVVSQVKQGEISEARLDDAVSRVLRVKMRAGLFEKSSPANRPLAGNQALIGAEEHREIAREAVRQSLVLLKNKNALLPLSPKQKIFVTGDGANNIGKQSGGWTITWQGTNNKNSDFPGATSIFDGIQRAVTAVGGEVELGTDQHYKQRPDVAIVVFGEEPYAEGVGDRDNLVYQRGVKKDLALLKALKSQGIPVVSLFISGRPLWVNAELNASDAFVAVWLPGSEGAAISDVIFRSSSGKIQHNFRGKLSYSWPRYSDQTSLNVGDENYDPLLSYGFGLRYGDKNVLPDTLTEVVSNNGMEELPPIALFSAGIKKPWGFTLHSSSKGTSQSMVSNVASLNTLRVRTADRNIQEDTLQIEWQGGASDALLLTADTPQNLQSYGESNSTLSFDVQRLVPVSSELYLTFDGQKVDISKIVGELSSAEWKTISVSLSCFTKQGAELADVKAPFGLQTDGKLGLRLGEVWLKAYSGASADITCEN